MAVYVDKSEQGLITEMQGVESKIGKYKDILVLDPADITGLIADIKVLVYMAAVGMILTNSSESANTYKRNVRLGIAVGALPVSPLFPTPIPTAVAAGIEKRFRAFCQAIFKSPGYTEEIGKDLGILLPDVAVDITLVTPFFTIDFTNNGHPIFSWRKSGFIQAEIWKSTDGINFVKLERVSIADYIDASTLPALNKSEAWSYKMIYLQKDVMVGKWSAVTTIAVLGH